MLGLRHNVSITLVVEYAPAKSGERPLQRSNLSLRRRKVLRNQSAIEPVYTFILRSKSGNTHKRTILRKITRL